VRGFGGVGRKLGPPSARRWGRGLGAAPLRLGAAFAALAAGGAGGVAATALPGRTRVAEEEASAARRAVATARAVGAAEWGPELLQEAEAVLRASFAEERRQAARLFLLRDYRAARRGYERARTLAERAAREATHRRARAAESAAACIAEAHRALREARRAGRTVWLSAAGRARVARAEHALAEARALFATGSYARAHGAARAAADAAEHAVAEAVRLTARFRDPAQLRRWRAWAEETVRFSAETGAAAIVVNKDRGLLTLYVAGRPVRSYRAEFGRNAAAPKIHAGDLATPEGRYRIVAKKGPDATRYHKALLLDYPNETDRQRFESARRAGRVPPGARPGGLIEIHGEGGRGRDWTDGCVALSNVDMDDLFSRVGIGTPVTVIGGDGAGGRFSELGARARLVGAGSAR
jgi:L,D-peptidoglycan transpeptidase YkuD (ErfK/YbiS/YcfS/YnhG family)